MDWKIRERKVKEEEVFARAREIRKPLLLLFHKIQLRK